MKAMFRPSSGSSHMLCGSSRNRVTTTPASLLRQTASSSRISISSSIRCSNNSRRGFPTFLYLRRCQEGIELEVAPISSSSASSVPLTKTHSVVIDNSAVAARTRTAAATVVLGASSSRTLRAAFQPTQQHNQHQRQQLGWQQMQCCWQQMRFAGFGRPQPNDIAAAFRVLNASSTDNDKELRKKYLKMVKENHPDRGGSEKKMKEITSSFDLLSSLTAQERKTYDEATRYASGAKRGSAGSGSYGSSSGSQGQGGGARPAGYAYTNTTSERAKARKYQSAYDFQNNYRERYEREQQKAYYAGQNASQGQGWRNGDSGFERPNPFQSSQMGRMMSSQAQAPMMNSIFKGVFIYIIVSTIFFSIYRSRLDEQHEAGWSAQSRYADRDRGDRYTTDHSNEHRTNIRDWDRSPFAYNDPRQQRVMDYAAKRAKELKNADFQSWPKLSADGKEGILFKRHQDPVGVTHYFPKPFPRPADIPAACAVGLGGALRQSSSMWFDNNSQELGDHRSGGTGNGANGDGAGNSNTPPLSPIAQEMQKHAQAVHTNLPAQMPTRTGEFINSQSAPPFPSSPSAGEPSTSSSSSSVFRSSPHLSSPPPSFLNTEINTINNAAATSGGGGGVSGTNPMAAGAPLNNGEPTSPPPPPPPPHARRGGSGGDYPLWSTPAMAEARAVAESARQGSSAGYYGNRDAEMR